MNTSHNNPLRRPLRLMLLKAAAMAVIAVAAVLTARHYIRKVKTSSTPAAVVKNERIDVTPSQIRSIEQIGEWAFLEVSDEEMVDTVRHGFFGDDELVRIYYGTLRLGIDLRQAHEGWLSMRGDTLHAILPPVRLLDNSFIDETRTRSFIESGKWTHQDRKDLYDRAELKMRRRCLTRDNYATARQNAREQLAQVLRSMGFERVRVE